jgi:hypothetical protein
MTRASGPLPGLDFDLALGGINTGGAGTARRRRGRLRAALVLGHRPPRRTSLSDQHSALDHEDAKALSAGTGGEDICALVRQVNDRHLVQALFALDQGPPKALPAYAGEEGFRLPPDHSGPEGDFPIPRSRALLAAGPGRRHSVYAPGIGASGRRSLHGQHEGGPNEEGRHECAFRCGLRSFGGLCGVAPVVSRQRSLCNRTPRAGVHHPSLLLGRCVSSRR